MSKKRKKKKTEEEEEKKKPRGRPIEYRKLYKEYKIAYQKQVEKLMKKGESPKEKMSTFRNFATSLEGQRTRLIEDRKKAPRRSRIITRVVQSQVFGGIFNAGQIKEFEKTRKEELLNKIETLKNEAAALVEKAKLENKLDTIEIQAKIKDIEEQQAQLDKLKEANAAELRLMLADYLKDLYKDLKDTGYTPTEAGKWISQNVFGSD